MKIGILDDPDLRVQRRERIRGHLRAGVRNRGQQRGLARVGIADQAHLGDDAQLEEKLAFLARFPGLGEARGLAPGGGKVPVAQPAAPALAEDEPLPGVGKINHQLAFLVGWARRARFDRFGRQVHFDGLAMSGGADHGPPAGGSRQPCRRVLVRVRGVFVRRGPGSGGQPPDQGAARHLHQQVLARMPVHAFAQAQLPVGRDQARLVELGD